MDKKIQDKLTETFVNHPMWPYMMELIESHFETSSSINGIDATNPSSTVHAEVIATQKIAADLQSLRDSFTAMKNGKGKNSPFSKLNQKYE